MQSVAARLETVKPALPGSTLTPAGTAGRERPHPLETWRQLLADAIRDPAELCRILGLPDAFATEARASAGAFPLLVPRGFVARMKPGDPHDPLLRQVLPLVAELKNPPGYGPDPLAEQGMMAAPALVQKYSHRALLLAAAGCAVNCRYCFRRSFPYGEAGVSQAGLVAGVEAIAADEHLEEVILSGGDPLLLDDDRLAWLVAQLEAIPHVVRLRLHSRLPVVLPERVTERLVAILAASRLQPVVVLHANHSAELDSSVAHACSRLLAGGVMLFNQAVLLAGVNDAAQTLVDLSLRLVSCRVTPYYLHLLDRVNGASHFEVDETKALALHAALKQRLPGYAVPRLVREIPGEPSKSWIHGEQCL